MNFYVETKSGNRLSFQKGQLGEVGKRSTKALKFKTEEEADKFLKERGIEDKTLKIVPVEADKSEDKKEDSDKKEEVKAEIKKDVHYVTAPNGVDLIEAK
tara:strand:- start:32295 stop:32594 length:300 start_codon:yes stop_codon:yes gene_type:complete